MSKDLKALTDKPAKAETVLKAPPRVTTKSTAKRRAPGKAPRRVASVNLDLKKAAPRRYVVQLASTRTEKNARRAWSELRKAHPALFADMRELVSRKNLGPKKGIWYRLIAGSFSDAGAARSFCGRAQKRKVACLVVRR